MAKLGFGFTIWTMSVAVMLVSVLVITAVNLSITVKVKNLVNNTPQEYEILYADIHVLQGLLAAEYLEEVFYSQGMSTLATAWNGHTVTNTVGNTYNGTRLYQNAVVVGGDESSHATLLNAKITEYCARLPVELSYNCAPITACTYSFSTPDAPTFAATAAVIEGLGEQFYLGAVGQVKTPEVVILVGSIYAVEAEHASFWREFNGVNVSPVDVVSPVSANTVLCTASGFVTNAGSCAPWDDRSC